MSDQPSNAVGEFDLRAEAERLARMAIGPRLYSKLLVADSAEAIHAALLAAERRGAERERERCARVAEAQADLAQRDRCPAEAATLRQFAATYRALADGKERG